MAESNNSDIIEGEIIEEETKALTLAPQEKIEDSALHELNKLRTVTSQDGWWVEDINNTLRRGTIAIEPRSMKVATKVEVVTVKGSEGKLDIPRMVPYGYDPRQDKPIEGNVIARVEITYHMGDRGRYPEEEISQLLSTGQWIIEESSVSEPGKTYIRTPGKETPELLNNYLYEAQSGEKPFYTDQEDMDAHIQEAIANYENTHGEVREQIRDMHPNDEVTFQHSVLTRITSEVAYDKTIPEADRIVLGFAANIQRENLNRK